ncbi:hypothetical protein GQ53DRAFT_839591 [Thozetella sp. PMI_491]|nr:hypothetical protein GQ53DRAFT_839591 [Thozetella sp. PMI_491]
MLPKILIVSVVLVTTALAMPLSSIKRSNALIIPKGVDSISIQDAGVVEEDTESE